MVLKGLGLESIKIGLKATQIAKLMSYLWTLY